MKELVLTACDHIGENQAFTRNHFQHEKLVINTFDRFACH